MLTPTTTASQISTGDFVSISPKNGNAHSVVITAPARYSGRRPTRSESDAPQRHRDQAERRGDDHAGEHRVLVEAELLLAVDVDEHGQQVEDAVLAHPHAHRGEHVARVLADDVDDRLPRPRSWSP